MKWLTKLSKKLRRLQAIQISGYHCGCCGAWVDDPKTVWRKEPELHPFDSACWGLCESCTKGGVKWDPTKPFGAFS